MGFKRTESINKCPRVASATGESILHSIFESLPIVVFHPNKPAFAFASALPQLTDLFLFSAVPTFREVLPLIFDCERDAVIQPRNKIGVKFITRRL